MLDLIRRVFPYPRSITGDGVRRTLAAVSEIIPLEISEVPTGTQVFDWEIPREWNLRGAWIKGPSGDKIIDAAASNLHVVGYSTPMHRRMSLAELRPHLRSDPAHPDWIPFRTSYFDEGWGFCMAHRQLQSLPDGEYEVCIEASLEPGSLTYGEFLVPGQSDEECLFFAHTCHPSLANDNLSGVAVAAHLGRWLAGRKNRYSYRILFAPATIGSLAWLARNPGARGRMRAGLVLTLLGRPTPLTYKRSRSGMAEIDRVAQACISAEDPQARILDFSPWGYDERQFGAPGLALPVGRLSRDVEEGYPEYHSSADNVDLLDADALAGSLAMARRILHTLEVNRRYRNLAPYGEPQLGKRGAYPKRGGSGSNELQRAVLWVLSLSDGTTDLVDIHRRSGIPFDIIQQAAELLLSKELLAT
jgi:aminopeptidase-like protein